ncbi:hypothetical protein COH20_011527 [Aspergillus flavus]|uniref:Uncharacterized protein n=1 Tax=Aspergillus flavus TaxID=5059 RepID=A0AB74C788_ASPFL|nr:hypothetical protein AFLA_010159 [Aspergillus flavus NRRL3357]RAQ72380.1 hypothetical protein COH20_011527 [Aspergillus flavus]RAQ78269.1 hypothetical protein COH21_008490 [Aspergillus flavus]RMZ42519.1 hypothetical protein CA14_002900 [Aspergillus flavus]
MPRDADFLSPRDLLINDNFCLKLASFKQLANVIVKTENLPRDDDSLRQKTGFWESGYQILYSYLNPIAQQFWTVQNVALNLNETYNYTDTVCQKVLDLCHRAPDDYDKFFTDLEALRKDPDNETLRKKVLQEVNDRHSEVKALRDQATIWSRDLHSYSMDAGDCETAVRDLAAPFQGSALRDRLIEDDAQDNLQDDLNALGNVKSLLDGFSMVDDMGASLEEVQKMSGSATLIEDDIQNLVDYLDKHVDPDDNPLGGLVERNLLKRWATLQEHGRQPTLALHFYHGHSAGLPEDGGLAFQRHGQKANPPVITVIAFKNAYRN